MEMSNQLQAPVNSAPEKGPMPTELEVEWDPEPV
jgi:hypothetical protein